MARNSRKLENDLYYLRKEKRALKQRISQSMSTTGPRCVTDKCKNLQQELAQVAKIEKKKTKKKQKMRRW